MSLNEIVIADHSFTVINLHGTNYLIGVMIAKFLNTETFNAYRSLKAHKIDMYRCNVNEILDICNNYALPRVNSMTLVPLTPELIMFIYKKYTRFFTQKPNQTVDRLTKWNNLIEYAVMENTLISV